MNYHVAKSGNDKNKGTEREPFLTISRAAEIAEAGDTVTVHDGEYRECVNPVNGGMADCKRITYKAAENEKVVIKGSEIITDWDKIDGVWKAVIPNTFFGDYNPYTKIIDGDWFMEPLDNPLHTGQVYMDGRALTETRSIEKVKNNTFTWYAETDGSNTVIYANFADHNPQSEMIEINVRRSCFYPEQTGVNYITVSGFEMAHAATQWAPPTAEQTGMLSVNWSKGWIIEDNILHDARCSAVCVGKERTTGHNVHTRYHRKPGYHTQLETVLAARHIGWDRERIGSHIIRNNTIYDCGQNAIVGHMCGAFSEIYGNHIYNIANKREFYGYEIAGIKLHAAIDTYIHHNNIHDCLLGTWLDWEAQGVRLSNNLYWSNETDVWVEVTHGPHIFDNNIFGSKKNIINAAQGGAYIHNLFCGTSSRYDVRNRSTPYHLPHSTEIMGCSVVFGGDDRYFNNIFVGTEETDGWTCGTKKYNGYTVSMDEYIEKAMENGRGDMENYENIPQPVYINNNCYLLGAEAFEREESCIKSVLEANIKITKADGEVFLEINMPEDFDALDTEIVKSHSLVFPRMSEAPYEAADGSEIVFCTDYCGAVRNDRPLPGPIENLKEGYNRVAVWKQVDRSEPYKALLACDADGFAEQISELLDSSISFYDRAENFYHGLVAGLLANNKYCKLESNRETGDGRCDIVLYQQDDDTNLPALATSTAKGTTAASENEYTKSFTENTEGSLTGRVKAPSDYLEKSYPLVVFLHGEEQKGTDNLSQLAVAQPLFEAARGSAILAAPQTADTWDADKIKAYIDAVKTEYNASDVAVCGYSMGAPICYELAKNNTAQRIIPIAGNAVLSENDITAIKNNNISAWVMSSYEDDEATVADIRTTVSAMQKAKADVIYTEYPLLAHDICEKALSQTELADWILDKAEEKKTVDLVLFAGQSNMAGRGDHESATICPPMQGYEFHTVTDALAGGSVSPVLSTVNEPFGKYENNSVMNDSKGTTVDRRNGDMVSSVMKAYYDKTGVPMVGVQASRGGEDTAYFKSDAIMTEIIKRYTDAEKYLEDAGYEVRKKFLVWCQGCSDADKIISDSTYTLDDYKANTLDIFNQIKTSTGMEDVFMVRIGHRNNNNTEDAVYKTINEAQAEIIADNEHIYEAGNLYTDTYKSKMRDAYHYYQSAYNSIGLTAGENIASVYLSGTDAPTDP